VREINLTQNAVAFVSDEDYEYINSFNWSYRPSENGLAYAVRKGRSKTNERRTVGMHREIITVPCGMQVDHINGNGLDNRRENLRIACVQTNAFNRGKPNVKCTSQYKGVLRRRGKTVWEARLKYNDKAIFLGNYVNEEDAASAYNHASELLFGEFAKPNPHIRETPPWIKNKVYQKCLHTVLKNDWHPKTGVFSFEEVANRE
jgi:hypothetical protein